MILPSFLHFCPIAPAVSEMFEPLPLQKQQGQWCKVGKKIPKKEGKFIIRPQSWGSMQMLRGTFNKFKNQQIHLSFFLLLLRHE